jgi:hypothetical protein
MTLGDLQRQQKRSKVAAQDGAAQTDVQDERRRAVLLRRLHLVEIITPIHLRATVVS